MGLIGSTAKDNNRMSVDIQEFIKKNTSTPIAKKKNDRFAGRNRFDGYR